MIYFTETKIRIKILISEKKENHAMRKQWKKIFVLILSVCLIFSGINIIPKEAKAADTLVNVANGRNGSTYMTSNANTSAEGFLYVGNGFSAINCCNENLTNGNNLLGKTATTEEVAVYVDLGKNYDISNARIYQGSTNANFYDSYCRSYKIYYATEQVSKTNEGKLTWSLAGQCDNGTIYNASTTKIKNAEHTSNTGDEILFDNVVTARSIKIVFDKEACMGTGSNGNNTGTCGTVSLLSVQIYGTEHAASTETSNEEKITSEEVVETKPDNGVTDILFVGNSMTYYNTLCKVVQGIVERKGHKVKCTAVTNGGKNLVYQSTAENVINAIKVGGYDIVVLQDIVGSFDGDKLQTAAETMIPMIKQYNPGVEIIFYEPWPTKDTILGTNGLLPYFTNSYVKTAKSMGAVLAPAGEAFYELYADNNLDYYCADNKHPQPLGTFTSASTIYYSIYPEEAYEAFTSADQSYLDQLINTNVAYTEEGKQNTYSLDTLNLIFSLGHKYAQAVIPAVQGTGTYTSVGGSYVDLDAEANPNGLKAVQGTEVDESLFTAANGNIAVGRKAYASSATSAGRGAEKAVDGTSAGDSRWESEFADPQWLYIDFGVAKTFDTVGFIWEGAYASKYYIQISDDAANWTTVAYVTATKKSTVQVDLGKTCNARYVRMYGTKRGTGYGYSFFEMGVWNYSGVEESTTAKVEVTTDTETESSSAVVETTVVSTTEKTTSEQATSEEVSTVVPVTTSSVENITTEMAVTTTPEVRVTTEGAATTTPASKVTTEAGKTETTTQPLPTVKVKVAKAKVKKAVKKKSSTKVKISLKRQKNISGYQIYILKKRHGKKTYVRRFVKKATFSLKSKKIRDKKKLFIKVRAYVIVNKKKYYGRWSKVQKIKTK